MENLRGSLFMTFAMATFALEDTFIKSASRFLPVGEILILFGLGGTLAFMFLTLKKKESILHPKILSRPIILRMICEIIGRLCFTIAIAFTPLSSASAILQATPLVVVMGVALLFKERVGWQRWLAIFIGFIGVLLILRPGFQGFEPASLFAVLGTLGFAGRDLSTRAAPTELSHMQLGVYGFFILIPAGIILMPFTGGFVWPDAEASLKIMGAIVFGVSAYYALTVAMRTGEVSIVTPFRYTRLVFALIIGVLIFSEQPDMMTLCGSSIIVFSGVFSLVRGRKKQRPKAYAT